jgi:hypothetical protein
VGNVKCPLLEQPFPKSGHLSSAGTGAFLSCWPKILTFYRTGEVRKVEKDREFNVAQVMRELLEETHGNKIYGEYLFNKIVVEAWKRSAIGSLNISRDAFIHLLEEDGWYYDAGTHCWVKVGHQSRLPFSVLD